MKTAWRIVMTVVLIIVALGLVGLGVGILTGAESERILSVLDDKYSLVMYYNYLVDIINSLLTPA